MKQILFSVLSLVAVVSIACSCASCKNATKAAAEPDTVALVGPTFRGDSAYVFAAKQCDFGPRVMNSAAHDRCGEWIMQKFREFGMSVEAQDAELKGASAPSRLHAYCSAPIGTVVRGQITTPTQPTGIVR